MLVTDDALMEGRDLVALCRAAVEGGVTSIQLRLKRVTARELGEAARALRGAVTVPLLLNDRLDVALAVGADGVHLGPDDLPVRLARRIAPEGFVIGASVGSEDEAADGAEADYWGVGPWAATRTKSDAGQPLGPEGFGAITALAGRRPCYAIGSVRPEDAPAIRRAGGAGCAVVSGILGSADVRAAARSYRDAWRSADYA